MESVYIILALNKYSTNPPYGYLQATFSYGHFSRVNAYLMLGVYSQHQKRIKLIKITKNQCLLRDRDKFSYPL